MDMAIMICLAILVFLACGGMFAVAYALTNFTKYLRDKDAKSEQLKYKDVDIVKIDKMFSDIIEREFNEYHKFHPELSQEGSYIKRDEIQQIVSDITTRVFTTITPAIRYNIGLIYDVSTDEKLINLIGERIGVLVMAMAATINSTLIDDTRVTLDIV